MLFSLINKTLLCIIYPLLYPLTNGVLPLLFPFFKERKIFEKKNQSDPASIPFQQIPERQLEHSLKKYRKNVKVFTLGTAGYGQDQQLLVLKEFFKKHRADLVLLLYSVCNDIDNNPMI